jgi:hypothetical protein
MTTTQITEQMVNAAQQAWCDRLAYLGTVDAEGGDVRAAAGTLVDAIYDYAEGTVFFKPTMALARTPSAAPDGRDFLLRRRRPRGIGFAFVLLDGRAALYVRR